jgi:hypothetical protein
MYINKDTTIINMCVIQFQGIMANKKIGYSRIALWVFSILLTSIFASSIFSIDGHADPLVIYDTISYLGNLSGNYSDHGTDLNDDGQYEFLTVEVGVNVQYPQEYSVMGYLYDRNNKEVAWAIDHKNLTSGFHNMRLDFDGKAIRSQGTNGPYQLRNVSLSSGNYDTGIGLVEQLPVAYNTSFYNASDFPSPVRSDKIISGSGNGELLLTIGIKKSLPVFAGKYSFDVDGINIPPISTRFSVKPLTGLNGYAYDLEGIYLPGKPNNFTVSAKGVKNINVGLKKLQGSYENSSMVWKTKSTRIWVTTQIPADKNGLATADSDLISPGVYQAKIFGDAADNVSQVDLSMTMVKKMVMKGKFNLAINTTGFPAGNYSITAKAINGSLSLDELTMDGMSIAQ